jgi:hypothetical protein
LLLEIENFLYLQDDYLFEDWQQDLLLSKIPFTESQKVIFERLYNKYEVLVWDDFWKYFKNSFLAPFLQKDWNSERKIEKRDVKRFLKELEEYLEGK